MNYPVLSNNELAVMRTLWNSDTALSRPEILARLPDQKWNPNSIHHILNNLMKKGFLTAVGMIRCGQSYGRTYAPLCTQAEYAASLALNAMPETMDRDEAALALMSAMARSSDYKPETIELLKKMLEEAKK